MSALKQKKATVKTEAKKIKQTLEKIKRRKQELMTWIIKNKPA